VFLPSPLRFPGLRNGNPAFGWVVAFGLPLLAIVCFIWPERLMRRFSPRIQPSNDYLLTESFWYCMGYAALIVGIGVLLLFREPLLP